MKDYQYLIIGGGMTGAAAVNGIPTENGIVVDQFLRTTNPDIYAAGDVAALQNPALGKRMRVGHEDNANTMGRLPVGTWRENLSLTIICPFSIPTCSSSDMKRWVKSIRAWKRVL